jgi:hypothetical protein
MYFEHPERHDPENLERIIRDQEQKALKELNNPTPNKKSRRVNIARRLTMIEGREQAVRERWY